MTAAEQSAYHEGRLASVREAREGGYSCPYRNGAKKAAWCRGLADGRNERTDAEHRELLAAVSESEREANKAAFNDTIQQWLAKQR